MSNAILNLPQGVLEFFQRDLDLVRERSAAEDAIFDAQRILDAASSMHYAHVISSVQKAVIHSAAIDTLRGCLDRLSRE